MSEQKPRVLLVNTSLRLALNPDHMSLTYDQADDLREQLAGIEPCVWTQQEDGQWQACGEMLFEFTGGRSREDKTKFCPYCGRKIKVKKYED